MISEEEPTQPEFDPVSVESNVAYLQPGKYAFDTSELTWRNAFRRLAWKNDTLFVEVIVRTDPTKATAKVVQLVGSPGDYTRKTMPVIDQFRLAQLLTHGGGALEHKLLYGMRSHECAECGSPLTQETSRERGMGPKCYAKLRKQL